MTYQLHATLPAYQQAPYPNLTALKWSGDLPPPDVGTEIIITMWQTPGAGIVTGYFEEAGWLGLMVRLYNPPDFIRERKVQGDAHVFGPEFRLPDKTGTPNELDLAALDSYAKEFGRNWKEKLRDDWFNARTRTCYEFPHRGNLLHGLRNSQHFGPRGLDKFTFTAKRKEPA